MRWVIFRVDDEGEEVYVKKLAQGGRVMQTKALEFALPFYTAEDAREWASEEVTLQEWKVGKRRRVGIWYSKDSARRVPHRAKGDLTT